MQLTHIEIFLDGYVLGSLGAGRDFNSQTIEFKGALQADDKHDCCRLCRQEYYDNKLFGFGYKEGYIGVCVCFAEGPSYLNEIGIYMRPTTVPGKHY